MSANDPLPQGTRVGRDGDDHKSGVVPKLVQETDADTIEFSPEVVTRLGGTLPWDTESTQLQCGETVTSNNGDLNFRVVYEAVCVQYQLDNLSQMRSNPSGITLVSPMYTGPVTFDELKIEHITDANGAVHAGVGEMSGPFYKIQLQSKEDDN